MSRLSIITIVILFYFGCTEVDFGRDPSFDPICQDFDQTCVMVDEIDYFDYELTIGDGLVDILFVDDNSGSMSTEQANMANYFPNFIESLSDLDYHIGIITTDVSSASNPSREVNQFGALQDGHFIKFDDGSEFLSRSTTDVENLFATTIVRQETLDCEAELQKSGKLTSSELCPSGDERGIYAANLAIDQAPAGFFRSRAHFAIVFLSDEDERSDGGLTSGYQLADKDKPQALVDKVKEVLSGGKTFTAHALIIQPGDTSCLSEQNSQPLGVKGFEGQNYSELVDLTSGVLGSVCSSDWGGQMGDIGYGVGEDVKKSQAIACSEPIDGIQIEFDFRTPRADITWDFDPVERVVRFDEELPVGTRIRFIYSCTTVRN